MFGLRCVATHSSGRPRARYDERAGEIRTASLCVGECQMTFSALTARGLCQDAYDLFVRVLLISAVIAGLIAIAIYPSTT
jgi:hypothetical protein